MDIFWSFIHKKVVMQKATYVHTVGILKVVKETFGHPPLLRLESCIP